MFVQILNNICFKSHILYSKHHVRAFYLSNLIHADTKPTEKEVSTQAFDILDELREPELTEEEILQKCFKARLPERVYRQFVAKEAIPIEAKYNFQLKRLRAYYGRHGKDSKLNPGICWPTREQILETIEDDKIFEPPLQVRIKNVEDARLAEENRKKAVEEEVDKNMAKLDKSIADYHAKHEKKKADLAELKLKKEKLVDEVTEYVGYDIDPRDPRFQEAVDQLQKQKKKDVKVKKQQESYEKMIAKLKQLAQK